MDPKHGASSLMDRRWVTPVGVAMVLLTFAGVCGIPYYRATARLRAETVAHRNAIERSARQSQELNDMTKQVQGLELEVQKYDRLVPSMAAKDQFSDALSHAQEQAKILDMSRAMYAPTKLGRCMQLPMELHMTCETERLFTFLEQLESLERRSSVSKLSIEADSAMTGTVTADITLAIYAAAPAGSTAKQ